MAFLKGNKKTDIVEGNLNPKWIVEKSDPLMLMCAIPFSLGELKILDTYISRINAADASHRTVVFTKEEYEKLMGLTCANPRSLDRCTDSLLCKRVRVKMPGGYFWKFNLFTSAGYLRDDYGKPIVELTCSEEAKELFFFIKDDGNTYQYFKYALENVIKLTRKASYLLYLHILHERYRGEWEIPLEELRDVVLDCQGQESYQEYKIFKRAVLDPAVKEVNKKTNCHFKYEPIKRGRWVIGIKFIYQSKQITGQMTIDELTNAPLLTDQSEKTEKEVDYGGELANLLGDAALNNEFSPEQVRVIQDLVLKAVKSNNHLELCDYLIERVHRMNAYNPAPAKRFAYLCKMLEKEI